MKIKKTYMSLLIMLCMIFAVSCEDKGKNETEDTGETEISRYAVDISTARESARSDYENAKTKYTNLEFSDITPYVTPYDTVYDIKYHQLGNYKDITDELEMYEEQMKLMNIYLGTDLKDEYFDCGYYDLTTNEYSSFSEFKEDLLSGKKMDATWLGYCDGEDTYLGKVMHAEIQRTLPNVYFSRGEAYVVISDEIKSTLELRDQPRYVCEMVNSYYVYGNDEGLDDVYKLADGELSIRDAVDFANNYINNEMGIEGNENVSLQVTNVEVYALNEEDYGYRFKIARNIYGLLAQPRDAGYTSTYGNINFDMTEAYMVYTYELDSYSGRTTRLNEETFNETDKIITLDRALSNISESIGSNSEYKIISAELGYLDIITDLTTSNEGIFTASWVIHCENLLDSGDTYFYVNARTGDINVYQFY